MRKYRKAPMADFMTTRRRRREESDRRDEEARIRGRKLRTTARRQTADELRRMGYGDQADETEAAIRRDEPAKPRKVTVPPRLTREELQEQRYRDMEVAEEEAFRLGEDEAQRAFDLIRKYPDLYGELDVVLSRFYGEALQMELSAHKAKAARAVSENEARRDSGG